MLIVGFYAYPLNPISHQPPQLNRDLVQIPMFLGPILLLVGFLINYFNNKEKVGKYFKILGWFTFCAYWATQPYYMYI